MIYHAKNGCLKIFGTDMDYICFGTGSENLVMIPGVGDGIKTVKGTAVPFALMYRKIAHKYRIYVFSRRNTLPEGFSTEDMAEDLNTAMEQLGIHSSYVLGVSQGGMIAQYLAIRHPEKVKKLVLAVTLARQNETVQNVVHNWIDMAKAGDYKGIMIDTARKSYSKQYWKKMRWMYSLFGGIGKPKSLSRFVVQANACVTHNAYDELKNIQCPTFIIGGEEDQIVTGRASEDINRQIRSSKLLMYQGLGHAAYEEAADFLDQVAEFCS